MSCGANEPRGRRVTDERYDPEILARVDELGLALPAGLPADTDLRPDPAGRVWLQRFQPPWEETGRWGVIDAGGSFLGHVQMPARFTVHQLGDGWVLGVKRDALEVERVELRAIERPE